MEICNCENLLLSEFITFHKHTKYSSNKGYLFKVDTKSIQAAVCTNYVQPQCRKLQFILHPLRGRPELSIVPNIFHIFLSWYFFWSFIWKFKP